VKTFDPHTVLQDEQAVTRTQLPVAKPFAAGVFNDIPASTIPKNAIAKSNGYISFLKYLMPVPGCRLWSSTRLPALSGRTGYTFSKTAGVITKSVGTNFTSADIGNYFVYDDGNAELITACGGTTQITVEASRHTYPTATHATGTAGYVRGPVNGTQKHITQKKIILHIDTRIFISSPEVSSYVQAFNVSQAQLSNKKSFIIEQGNYAFIVCDGKIYRLDLTQSPYYFWQVNSPIPTTFLTEVAQSAVNTYGYKYIYTLSRISGEGDTRDRNTAGSVVEHETGPLPADVNGVDYTEVFAPRPVGDATTTYSILTGAALTAPYNVPNAWASITNGQFTITLNGTAYVVAVDFTGVLTMPDVAARIQAGLQGCIPTALCVFSSDHFIITMPQEGDTLTVTSAGPSGTDIGSTAMKCQNGTGTVTTPTFSNMLSVGNMAIPVDVSSNKQWHHTHYTRYRTLDIGIAGINPINGERNNEEQLIWEADIPVAKAFLLTIQGAVIIGGKLTSPYNAITAWKAIIDGSITFSVDGVSYSLVALDFSSCNTMAEVAEVINAALRNVAGTNVVFSYATNKFVLVNSSNTGSLGYTSAGVSGTDIDLFAACCTPYSRVSEITGAALVAPYDIYSGWTGIHNGAFGIRNANSGVVYEVSGLDFSSCTSMYDIAQIIANNNAFKTSGFLCRFEKDHFLISWTWVTQTIGFTVASAVGGTDIGASILGCDVSQGTITTGARIGGNLSSEKTLVSSDGSFQQCDSGSKLLLQNGVQLTIDTYLSPNSVTVFENIVSSNTPIAGAIGGDTSTIGGIRVITASQAGTTITKTVGADFTSSDVGKTIFWAGGHRSVIAALLTAATVTAVVSESISSTAACLDPVCRSAADFTSDADMRPRITNFSLMHRFWQPFPSVDTFCIVPGFSFADLRDDTLCYYSNIGQGQEYLIGSYNPSYQFLRTKEPIKALRGFPDFVIIYCANYRVKVPINTWLTKDINGIISIFLISGQYDQEDQVGIKDYSAICRLPDGTDYVVTGEPAVRIYDGTTLGENLLKDRMLKTIELFQDGLSILYDPFNGISIYGPTTASGPHADACVRHGIVEEEQGIGPYGLPCDDMPLPEARVGVLLISDSNALLRGLVLDFETGQWWDVTTRPGKAGSGMSYSWTGISGNKIQRSVSLMEDCGTYEHEVLEHLLSHIYMRPLDPANRGQAGYDVAGFPSDLEINLNLYVNGEQTTPTTTIKDIFKTAGDLKTDRKVQGNRIQLEIVSNTGDHIITQRQQYYVQKDEAAGPELSENNEMAWQAELADTLFWMSIYKGDYE